MRSPATSRLRARGWPDEPPTPRFGASNQRLDGTPTNPLAFVGAERVAVEEVFAPHHVITTQVDNPEVGVKCGGDVALAFESKAARDVGGGDGRHLRQVETVLGQQQLAGRLAPGDAAPDLGEVVTRLEVERAGRVIGDDHLRSP